MAIRSSQSRAANVPSIPAVPGGLDPALVSFLRPIKTTIDTREGRISGKIDQLVTFKALSELGIDINSQYQAYSKPPTGKITGDSLPPGMPTAFTVTATGINSHRLVWTNPTDDDLWAVEVWFSTTQDITMASLLAVVTIPDAHRGAESVYVSTGIDPTQPYHYWLRSKDWSGNLSNFSSPGTVVAADNPTLDDLMTMLVGEVDYAHLEQTLKTNYDNTHDKYVLSVNADDHVSGMIWTNDGTVSDVTIVCNKFKIVNNTDPGNITVPFVVGDINGSPAVGINGALVVDGSIQARSIVANSITSTEINTSSITITAFSGVGDLATANSVDYDTQVTNKPTVRQIFYQSSYPTFGTYNPGDFWIDSDDNQMYRRNSGDTAWESVQDDDIISALGQATGAADLADEKAHVYFQSSAPTGLGSSDAGDLWFETDNRNKPYRWTGSAWTPAEQDWSNIADALGDKPDDNATVGASWPSNLSDIPIRFADAPSTDGLYVTESYMGFYNSGWKTYFKSDGDFYFGGNSNNYISWNGSSFVFATDDTVELKGGGDLILRGHASNPAQFIIYDPNNTKVMTLDSSSSIGVDFKPGTSSSILSLGKGSNKWAYLYRYASQDIIDSAPEIKLEVSTDLQLIKGSTTLRYNGTDFGPDYLDSVNLGTSSDPWNYIHGKRLSINNSLSSTTVSALIYGYGTGSSTYGIVVRASDADDTFFVRDDGVVWSNFGQWSSSDRRLKDRITPINESGIVKIRQLSPIRHEYTRMPGVKFTGFEAQAVEAPIPEAVMDVTLPSGDNIKIMNETKLIPHMVICDQEQQNQIDAIVSRLETLEAAAMAA